MKAASRFQDSVAQFSAREETGVPSLRAEYLAISAAVRTTTKSSTH
jgi:hypothetical protein